MKVLEAPASSRDEAVAGQIGCLDTLESKPSYILCCPNGRQLRLTASAHSLLQAVDGGVSFEDLADRLNARPDARPVTADDLRKSYEKLTSRLAKGRTDPLANSLPWSFWARKRLIGAEQVLRTTSSLTWLFKPPLVIIVCSAIFLAVTYLVKAFSLRLTGEALMQGYLLFLLSLIIHEFGHATACTYHGARPSDIGFTFYLIFPAFYSDVSDAWRLSRWRRVTVDLGGCYFQGIAGLFYFAIYLATGWDAYRLAVVMILYSCIFSLNPIFKFDGYWVLSDALGVVNLGQQPRRLLAHILKRGKKKPERSELPWPFAISLLLVAYSLAALVVWSGFVLRLPPLLLARGRMLVTSVQPIVTALRSHVPPSPSSIFGFLFSAALFGVLLIAIVQLARRIALRIMRSVRRS